MKKPLLFIISTLVLIRLYFLLEPYLSFHFLKNSQTILIEYADQNYVLSMVAFTLSYFVLVCVSIPVAAVFSVLGGMLFGYWSMIPSVLATSGGSVVALFILRYFFHDFINQRFHKSIVKINRFLNANSKLTIFTLRFSPIFPFYLVTILLSVTKVNLKDYIIIGMLSKLPILFILTYIGINLSEVASIDDIISMKILIPMFIVSLLPWAYKIWLKKHHPEYNQL